MASDVCSAIQQTTMKVRILTSPFGTTYSKLLDKTFNLTAHNGSPVIVTHTAIDLQAYGISASWKGKI